MSEPGFESRLSAFGAADLNLPIVLPQICVVLFWGVKQNRDTRRNCLNMLLGFFITPLINVCWVLLTVALFTWDFRHCTTKALLIFQ